MKRKRHEKRQTDRQAKPSVATLLRRDQCDTAAELDLQIACCGVLIGLFYTSAITTVALDPTSKLGPMLAIPTLPSAGGRAATTWTTSLQ